MVTTGYTDAKVIPYINGIRLDNIDLSALISTYPDLIHYIENEKK